MENKQFKTRRAATRYLNRARKAGFITKLEYYPTVLGKPGWIVFVGGRMNPSKLRKGIRGLIKLVGTGRNRRLEIRT